MTLASSALRRSRSTAQLSQRALARTTLVDQPVIAAIERGRRDPSSALLARLLAGAGCTLVLVPTTAPLPAAFVDEIAAHLRHGDDDRAFRAFLGLNDTLTRLTDGVLVAVTLADPGATGATRWDALVAGLVEHHLTTRNLPTPSWIADPARTLAAQWFVDDGPYARAHDQAATPAAFAHRGVYLAASELEGSRLVEHAVTSYRDPEMTR